MMPSLPTCPVCRQLLQVCVCGATPAGTAEVAEASRYVKRYGVTYCRVCNLAAIYCKGHVPGGQPSQDGAESGLARRIAETKR